MWWQDLLVVVLWFSSAYLHELGHYVVARRLNIYKGWFFHGLVAGIEMNDILPRGHLYLAGIAWSFLTYPVMLLFVSWGWAEPSLVWAWPIILFVMGIMDILVAINHRSVVRYRKHVKFSVMKKSWFNVWWFKLFNVDYEDSGVIWVYDR